MDTSKNEGITLRKSHSATYGPMVVVAGLAIFHAFFSDVGDENDYIEWSISRTLGPGATFYMMNNTEKVALEALPFSSRTRGNFDYTALLSDEEASASGTFYPAYSDTWWFIPVFHYTDFSGNVAGTRFNYKYDDIITVDEPTNSRYWEVNTSHYINWTSGGDFANVDVDLYYDGNFLRNIATNAQNNGSYFWRVPADISLFDDLYQVNISNTDFTDTWGISDSYFEITEERSINVTKPSTSNSWVNGTSEYINWTSTGVISNVMIELYNNDAIEMEITPNTPNNGEYLWAIPSGLGGSDQYQIKISDESDPLLYNFSDYFRIFSLNAPSDFTVEAGYTGQSISWTVTAANPNTYTIELQGTGFVAGPTAWTSGNAITYNITDGFSVGSYIYTVNFTDDSGNFITDSVNFTVEDTISPIITNATNDFSVEYGYTGQSISWTATDPNPNTYTVKNSSSDIVAGPTSWTNDSAITYNIPNGFVVGAYVYTVNFTDDDGNFITDSVTFTVEDTINPIVTPLTANHTVEAGYIGALLLWMATDANPDTYTVELLGTGLVAGPTAWTSGNAINYSIPTGFGAGSYIYKVNFTDISGNFATDSINFTVIDTISPIITSAPSDLTVLAGYTDQSLSWTATDLNPNNYTIELQGTGKVTGPIFWTSGVEITYDLPDNLAVGVYTYTVNFTDDSGNSITNIVLFTVEANSIEDNTSPTITSAPSDLTLDAGYMGESLSWTATDEFPAYYDINLQGSGMQAGGLAWTSGNPITYNIPDDLAEGVYVYTVTFTDENNNFISDSVTVTINADISPPAPAGGVPFGNFFLIIIGLSVLGLIFAKKRQMNRESRN